MSKNKNKNIRPQHIFETKAKEAWGKHLTSRFFIFISSWTLHSKKGGIKVRLKRYERLRLKMHYYGLIITYFISMITLSYSILVFVTRGSLKRFDTSTLIMRKYALKNAQLHHNTSWSCNKILDFIYKSTPFNDIF